MPATEDTGQTVMLKFTASDGVLSETRSVSVRVIETTPLAVVSAASYRGGSLAPDSIVAAFGVNLAVRTESARETPLPLERLLQAGKQRVERPAHACKLVAAVHYGQTASRIARVHVAGSSGHAVDGEQRPPAHDSSDKQGKKPHPCRKPNQDDRQSPKRRPRWLQRDGGRECQGRIFPLLLVLS